jgi:hypothetical protein
MSEATLQELVNEIIKNERLTEKEKKDNLFEIDSIMYTNLGTDSTKTEREKK